MENNENTFNKEEDIINYNIERFYNAKLTLSDVIKEIVNSNTN